MPAPFTAPIWSFGALRLIMTTAARKAHSEAAANAGTFSNSPCAGPPRGLQREVYSRVAAAHRPALLGCGTRGQSSCAPAAAVRPRQTQGALDAVMVMTPAEALSAREPPKEASSGTPCLHTPAHLSASRAQQLAEQGSMIVKEHSQPCPRTPVSAGRRLQRTKLPLQLAVLQPAAAGQRVRRMCRAA